MANLLEQMYLDLNAYSETSISLLDTDLSLFLLPFYANPPEVKLWDVPIAVAALESMKSYSWDVTLYKVSLRFSFRILSCSHLPSLDVDRSAVSSME